MGVYIDVFTVICQYAQMHVLLSSDAHFTDMHKAVKYYNSSAVQWALFWLFSN